MLREFEGSNLKPVGRNHGLNMLESRHCQEQETISGCALLSFFNFIENSILEPSTGHLHRLSTATQALEGLLGDFPTSFQHFPESWDGEGKQDRQG